MIAYDVKMDNFYFSFVLEGVLYRKYMVISQKKMFLKNRKILPVLKRRFYGNYLFERQAEQDLARLKIYISNDHSINRRNVM